MIPDDIRQCFLTRKKPIHDVLLERGRSAKEAEEIAIIAAWLQLSREVKTALDESIPRVPLEDR